MEEFLKGIKVVCFETAGSGPTASKLLAEYGADVILLEPVKGVNTRITRNFDFYFMGKRSLAVNLKTKEGKEALSRLLSKADIFVSNYRTRAIVRMGLDYETLHPLYPRLIHATLSGYGEKGPLKDAPGFDTTAYWGRAGIAKAIMERGGDPIVMPFAVGDIASGCILCMGILGALYKRERTGEGSHVSVSLLGMGLFQNEEQIFYEQLGYHYPQSRLEPRRAYANSYKLKDGYFQFHTLKPDVDMPKVMHIIGRDEEGTDPRFVGHWSDDGETAIAIRKILDEGFADMTVAEAREKFAQEDVAFGEIFGPADVIKDPQAIANNMLYKHTNLNGITSIMAASPLKFGDDELPPDRPAPRLGQHTEEILQEAGYSEAEIRELEDRGIVYAEQDRSESQT